MTGFLVLVVLAGIAFVAYRAYRARPEGGNIESGISSFRREMQALAPPPDHVERPRPTEHLEPDERDRPGPVDG